MGWMHYTDVQHRSAAAAGKPQKERTLRALIVIMSTRKVEQGANADNNLAAIGTGGSLGIAGSTDRSQPRASTGPSQDKKSYVSSTAIPSGDSRRADGSNDLTSEGTADTTAVAGAAGTDITAATAYGSRKSPDGANDGLQGGLHRPDFLSKGEHIPEGMGAAPETSSGVAAADAKRQDAGALSGDFDAADVDAFQRKLEQQH